MAALPDSGEFIYNGVTFPTTCTTKINGVPEYDSSKRSVKYMVWTIDVHAWFSGDDLGMTMEELRKRLSKPGKALRYVDKGFGELRVNDGTKVLDANWGPLPQLYTFHPLGGGRGCTLDWRVTCHIGECDLARYEGISALVYEIDWTIDVDGFSERRIQGHVEIAQTRQKGNSRVKTSADSFREKIVPHLPLKFRRESQNYKLSSNRNRLDFAFVDKELPESLPDGVSQIEFEHSDSSTIEKGFNIWEIQFSGSATAVAGRGLSVALSALLQTMGKRVNAIRAGRKLTLEESIKLKYFPFLGNQGLTMLPVSVRFSESMYGRTVRLDATWNLMGTSREKILADSNIFLPVGNDPKIWKKNTHDVFINSRGNAIMRYMADEEALIDLCLPPEASTNTTTSELRGGKNAVPAGNAAPQGNEPLVNANASWLSYKNHLKNVTENRVAIHKRIPIEDPEKLDPKLKGPAADGKVDAIRKETKAEVPGKLPPVEQRDVIQKLGASSHLIRMYGAAARLQHKIPAPRLLKVGGLDAVQLSADIDQADAGSIGDVTIQVTTWDILYAIAGRPDGEIPSLANPVFGTDGGKG